MLNPAGLSLLFLTVVATCPVALAARGVEIAQAEPHRRIQWWREARFGMFIHWGIYSAFEGRWSGERLRNPVPYGEWIRARNRVPRAEYDEGIRRLRLTPEAIEGWAVAAKNAGMKYLVITAKHHDGFALWPSQVSNYNYPVQTGSGLDVLGELKRACDRHGLKLGFYYSHWHDWEHPYGWGNFWDYNDNDPRQFDQDWNGPLWSGALFRNNLTPEQFGQYWRQKAMPQVAELINHYRPAILWFDCWLPREQTVMTRRQVDDMLALVRRLDPLCLVNTRLGIAEVGGDGVDFETTGDNEFPAGGAAHPWESPATFNRSWGYNRDDQGWRSTTYFIRSLVKNISLGGNVILNVGPQADGAVPQEILTRLREIGDCLRANNHGEGFYASGATPLADFTQDWGLTTTRATADGKHHLYLHVFDWPPDGLVRVNGLKTRVKAARLVINRQALPFAQRGLSAHIQVPPRSPRAYDTVIALELDGPAAADNSVVGELNGGGFHLSPRRASLTAATLAPAKDAWHPEHLADWNRKDAAAAWTVFIPEAGGRQVRVSYACALENAGQEFIVAAGNGQQLKAVTAGTHKKWDEFRPFTLGEFMFPSPGEYRITVKPAQPTDKELFKLLWVHLGDVKR